VSWKGMKWGMSNGFLFVVEGAILSVSRVGFVHTTPIVRTSKGCFPRHGSGLVLAHIGALSKTIFN